MRIARVLRTIPRISPPKEPCEIARKLDRVGDRLEGISFALSVIAGISAASLFKSA